MVISALLPCEHGLGKACAAVAALCTAIRMCMVSMAVLYVSLPTCVILWNPLQGHQERYFHADAFS